MIDNTPNQPSKFKTENWVEVKDDLYGVYGNGSQIKFKTSMLKSSSCCYNDMYILVNRNVTVPNTAVPNNSNTQVIFKNFAPFTNCITEVNNIEIDHPKGTDVVIPMYNLIK